MSRTIDIDLLRLVLLEAENINEPYGQPIKVKGYNNPEVNLVIELLESHELLEVFEDTLLLKETVNSFVDVEVPIFVQRITEEGIKFLNAVRTESELENIKDIAFKKNINDVRGFIKKVLS